MAECLECGDDFRLEDGYEDDGMCHQCAHAIAEGQNSRMVSERDLTIRDLRAELATLRARVEKAEKDRDDALVRAADDANEYAARLAAMQRRAERYREALTKSLGLIAANRLVLGEHMGPEYVARVEKQGREALAAGVGDG